MEKSISIHEHKSKHIAQHTAPNIFEREKEKNPYYFMAGLNNRFFFLFLP